MTTPVLTPEPRNRPASETLTSRSPRNGAARGGSGTTGMLAIKKNAASVGLAVAPGTPVPTIGPKDVLIAVTHAGICGTDRHIYEWDAWSSARVPIGITTGHEFVGRIAAVGSAVEGLHVGQRVSGEGHIGCGVCQPCRTGNAHVCEKVQIIGVDRDGCFAEYVSLPQQNVWPVHEEIPDHLAALFDPLGNAVHTVMAAGVSGKRVVITGVGTIGLMAVAVARAAGARQVIAVDVDDRRLNLAQELGADLTLRADEGDWAKKVFAATDNQGAQALLEMSGNGRAIRAGFAALQNGGTAALLGIPSRPVELDLPNDIIFKGLTVLGINGRRMFETWYQSEGFLRTPSVRTALERIVTHTLPLDQIDRGVKLMQSGEAIKVILEVAR